MGPGCGTWFVSLTWRFEFPTFMENMCSSCVDCEKRAAELEV